MQRMLVALAVTAAAVLLSASPVPGAPLTAFAAAGSHVIDPPPLGLPYVHEIRLCPKGACNGIGRPICPRDSISVLLKGVFPSDCFRVRRIGLWYPPYRPPGGQPWVLIVVDDFSCLGRPCLEGSFPWRGETTLPPLPEGQQSVTVALAQVSCSDVLPPPDQWKTTQVPVYVTEPCDTIPPPPPLPFVQEVRICPKDDCGDYHHEICPSDSITVRITGEFPNDCFRLCDVKVLYPLYDTIRPEAPWVVLVVDDGSDLGRPCIQGSYPFKGQVTFGPLPPGIFHLTVMMADARCGDPLPPQDEWRRMLVPFQVLQCVPPPPLYCVLPSWKHPGPDRCDALVTPLESARVTFLLRTNTPLAGLQGRFSIRPLGLRISDLRAVGPAESMHLTWTPTDEGGAQFVMFAESGAPIPITPYNEPSPPILELTVEASPDLPIPPVSHVRNVDLLGADADGHGVPPCPVIAVGPYDPGSLIEETAEICAQNDCDFNHDGRTDIRDLVLMVRCVREELQCVAFDCDANGTSDLDDVLCCARRILGMRCMIPEGCTPDPTPGQRDDNVHVSVGLATESGDGVLVPIRIEGAERLGAARLAMRFPADRYRVVSLDTAEPSWLALATQESGEVVMVVIGLSGRRPETGRTLDLTLRLERTEGGTGGGELGSLQGDFSAPDGTRLIVRVSGPSRPLPGGAEIQLSENRPDPFSSETRFTLALPRQASVDLAIYDVNGRRVRTVHRGTLPAGVSEFMWNGQTDARGRAESGVYFYRAAVDGQAVSRKMVLMGGD